MRFDSGKSKRDHAFLSRGFLTIVFTSALASCLFLSNITYTRLSPVGHSSRTLDFLRRSGNSSSTLFPLLSIGKSNVSLSAQTVVVFHLKSNVPTDQQITSFLENGELHFILVPDFNVVQRFEAWEKLQFSYPNVHFLSDAVVNGSPFYDLIYHRRNAAFLFAMKLGAKQIWETTSRNTINFSKLLDLISSRSGDRRVPVAMCETAVCNLYPVFKPEISGTKIAAPLIAPTGLHPSIDHGYTRILPNDNVVSERVVLYQNLLDGNPAVIPSLSSTNITFRERSLSVALPLGRYTPMTSPDMLWTEQSFPLLMLAPSLNEATADIVRSLIAQHVLASYGMYAAVSSPVSFANLTSEFNPSVNYVDSNFITRVMRNIQKISLTSQLHEHRIQQITATLSSTGILEKKDIIAYNTWYKALRIVGIRLPREEVPLQQRRPSFPKVKQRKPKVAVCVSGQVRTLTLPINDDDHPGWFTKQDTSRVPNMTVADSIQKNLFTKLGDPDVFVYISTREGKYEPKANNRSVCEPLRPQGNGKFFCEVPEEKDLLIANHTMWKTFGWPTERLRQGFLQQMHGLYQCHRQILQHSFDSGDTYDWIVRLRADSYILEFPDLEELARTIEKRTILYSVKKICTSGNEDTFAIGPSFIMRWYFERFLYLQTTEWKYDEWWNSESFVIQFMKSFKVNMLPHNMIQVCTVKPKHRKAFSDP